MIDVRKGLFAGLLALLVVGCSSPEPQEIDIDEVAVKAGLSKDDYIVHDNGAMEIESKAKADDTANAYTDKPLAMQGNNWKYVVSNALFVANAHAVKNNPSAVYLPQGSDISLIEQIGGEYKGEHLLTVVNDNCGDISYVQLRPLFDVNKSSDLLEEQLNEETPLWEVIIAKYNGQEF